MIYSPKLRPDILQKDHEEEWSYQIAYHTGAHTMPSYISLENSDISIKIGDPKRPYNAAEANYDLDKLFDGIILALKSAQRTRWFE